MVLKTLVRSSTLSPSEASQCRRNNRANLLPNDMWFRISCSAFTEKEFTDAEVDASSSSPHCFHSERARAITNVVEAFSTLVFHQVYVPISTKKPICRVVGQLRHSPSTKPPRTPALGGAWAQPYTKSRHLNAKSHS